MYADYENQTETGENSEDNKMSKMRHLKKREDIERIARTTKQRLVLVIAFLLAIILILIFRVGEVLWPGWMIEYRTQIMGIMLFILFPLILFSPVIIKVNSDPRVLSGPGKDPRQGWDP
jgi:hypothetical protein